MWNSRNLLLLLSGISVIAGTSFAKADSNRNVAQKAEVIINTISNSGERTVSLTLCETEKSSQRCKPGSTGLKGGGLGGAFLPLGLNLQKIVAKNGEINFESKINGVDVKCAPTKVRERRKEGQLRFDPFYCNWLVIGNVVTNYRLEIDWISKNGRTFGGDYRLSFLGTGNGGGRGSYRASF